MQSRKVIPRLRLHFAEFLEAQQILNPRIEKTMEKLHITKISSLKPPGSVSVRNIYLGSLENSLSLKLIAWILI
jgi:hypothetical protein